MEIGMISGVVKEGDVLVIEGGVPRHIIVPKKRADVVAGAYAAVISDHPNTVYIDAKEVAEEDVPKIEEIAKRKLIEIVKANAKLIEEAELDKTAAKRPSAVNIGNTKHGNNIGNNKDNGQNFKGSKDTSKGNAGIDTPMKKADNGIAKVNVKVLSLSEPESGPESEPVIVAEVEGPKGKFKVVARGKHAERLIALEGQSACLWMGKRVDRKYGAYEVEEVHFSTKRATVDTKVSCVDGDYTAEGKEGQQVPITAFDIETIQKLEEVANTGQKVQLILEHSEAAQGSFVVTEVLSVEAKPIEKAS
ncbi:hypothetical protein AN618_18770 [Fervidicola ferrireducens]|uniref:Uncharacterized protein n=1 Tax=Fervidicola ferrireducens TaxID=520764 RepID=A0A140L4M9_9FIRM|nr:hypothetical protein [Fervidicola ferrireducens]KXG75504.1 hypothetical protein AN618_18770 [Fervidicola ferrireducens]